MIKTSVPRIHRTGKRLTPRWFARRGTIDRSRRHAPYLSLPDSESWPRVRSAAQICLQPEKTDLHRSNFSAPDAAGQGPDEVASACRHRKRTAARLEGGQFLPRPPPYTGRHSERRDDRYPSRWNCRLARLDLVGS